MSLQNDAGPGKFISIDTAVNWGMLPFSHGCISMLVIVVGYFLRYLLNDV